MKVDVYKILVSLGAAIRERKGRKSSQKHISAIESYFRDSKTTLDIQRIALIEILTKLGKLSSEEKENEAFDMALDMIIDEVFGSEVYEQPESLLGMYV